MAETAESASFLHSETDMEEPMQISSTQNNFVPPIGSSRSRTQWQMRLLPDAMDCLRDHPRSDWQDARDQHLGGKASTQEILLAHAVVEEDRVPLFHLELLNVFRQRLRLLAAIGIVLLPIFHLFYTFLAPQLAGQLLIPHGLMLTVCLAYAVFAPHISNMLWARILSVAGYALICTGAALVMAVLAQSSLEDTNARSVHFVIFAAHSQILLSVVLLPLTVWESLVMASIVAGSLAWSAWWTLPSDAGPTRTAQFFVLATTAVFVLCVAQLQSTLRRRAFDSAFDLARSASQLEALSTLDAVTGGFNRLYLQKTLTLEINRAARFAHPLSVMMFDLDNFKAVNDTQGHNAGDEVLRVVWDASAAAVRDVDTVARYGGDEFMVVLPETEIEDARAIAQRLQENTQAALHAHFERMDVACPVTLSIGIVTIYPTEPVPVERVIALADERLYEAKRMGKNRIAV